VSLARKPLVLVVDDDPSIQHLLERLLRLHGFMPLHATNVAEAISVATSKRVEAVVLDLGLRGGDSGMDVLQALRQHSAYSSVPVLVLTGLLLTNEDEETLRQHHAEVLVKPQPMHRVIEYLKRTIAA
jgi:two-component system KDP operon response regulator KdpE